MEQFNLNKWLQDKSRKVVTRYGDREVRIICTDRKDKRPIVALMIDMDDGSEYITSHSINGWIDDEEKYPDKRDLFFADEEEELTEFEKELNRIVIAFSDAHAYMNKNKIHYYSKGLLDLAKKETLKEQDNCVIIPEDDYYEQLSSQYHIGHEDALKSLPKWKKVPSHEKQTMYGMSEISDVYYNGYFIHLDDIFKALPKEE